MTMKPSRTSTKQQRCLAVRFASSVLFPVYCTLLALYSSSQLQPVTAQWHCTHSFHALFPCCPLSITVDWPPHTTPFSPALSHLGCRFHVVVFENAADQADVVRHDALAIYNVFQHDIQCHFPVAVLVAPVERVGVLCHNGSNRRAMAVISQLVGLWKGEQGEKTSSMLLRRKMVSRLVEQGRERGEGEDREAEVEAEEEREGGI